ncbi:MAG: chromosome segregation protein SMC [Acidimicrobiales bacterium]
MYLKYLTLKGFKSFAEPVRIEMSPGLTVVVGPNGSGKSNVVDALAWVLGAQGPKQLRSSKMEDVIFAGTARRGALGRAEVSLVFDNSEGELTIGASEIAISRHLFRSGDSGYQLNGVSCRLTDLVDLLSDAGVGKTQHVIISQGEVDDIVNSKTEERRLVIEEAAGILKYKRRRERAARRLDDAELDIEKVVSMQRELRKQIRPLRKQAEAARTRSSLLERHRALSLWIAHHELADLKARVGVDEREHRSMSEELVRLQSELVDLDRKIADLNELDTSDAPRLEVLSRALSAMSPRLRSLSTVLKERQQSIAERRRVLVDERIVAAVEVEIAQAEATVESVARDGERLLERERALEEAESGLAAVVLPEVGDVEGALREAESERASLETREALLRRELRRAEDDRRSKIERRAQLQRSSERLEALQERDERRLEELQNERDVLEREIEEASNGLAELVARSAQVETTYLEVLEATKVVEGERRALESIDADLTAGALGGEVAGVEGFVGLVIELFDVDEGYEFALEAALGPFGYHGLVRDTAVGRRAFEALRASGRSGTLRIESEMSIREPIGRARAAQSELVYLSSVTRPTDTSSSIVTRSLIDGVVVAEDCDEALEILASNSHDDVELVVTKSGERFARDEMSLASRGGRALRLRRDRIDARYQEQRLALSEQEREQRLIKEVLGTAQRRQHALEASLQRMLSEEEGLRRSLAGRIEEIGRLAESRLDDDGEDSVGRLEEIVGELEVLEVELPRVRKQVAELVERRRAVEDERSAHRKRSDRLVAERGQLRVEAAQLEARARAAEVALRSTRERREEQVERVERDKRERAELDRRQRALEEHIHNVERIESQRELISAEIERRRRAVGERERSAGLARATLVGEREKLVSRLEGMNSSRSTLEISIATARTRYETTLEGHLRYLEVPIEEIEQALPVAGVSLTYAPQERARIEQEIREVGEVNAFAEIELSELLERETFLEVQLDDARDSKRKLASVLSHVEDEMQEIFLATFREVSASFELLFGRLFPGGVGKLILSEPDKPMSSGIELEIDLPAKRVRRLSLLSGGERSLVGLAFLFAVFRARPAPFVVLDEVEAALDDRNLSAFVRLIEEFRSSTQLIVITHQKRTMEIADVLVGVSLGGDGSSRLLRENLAAYLPLSS